MNISKRFPPPAVSSRASARTWPKIIVGFMEAPTYPHNIRCHSWLFLPKISFILNQNYQAHMKCIVDQYDRKGRRFDSADDAPDTSYYQWVVFVFAFQVIFVLMKTTKISRWLDSIVQRRQQSSTSRSSFGQCWRPILLPPLVLMARALSCSVRMLSTTMELFRYRDLNLTCTCPGCALA